MEERGGSVGDSKRSAGHRKISITPDTHSHPRRGEESPLSPVCAYTRRSQRRHGVLDSAGVDGERAAPHQFHAHPAGMRRSAGDVLPCDPAQCWASASMRSAAKLDEPALPADFAPCHVGHALRRPCWLREQVHARARDLVGVRVGKTLYGAWQALGIQQHFGAVVRRGYDLRGRGFDSRGWGPILGCTPRFAFTRGVFMGVSAGLSRPCLICS